MTPPSWRVGDRVLAPWEPDWYYPGKVRGLDARGAFIEFDDGDMAAVPAHDLRPIELVPGARVQARINRGPKQYRAAALIAVRGEEVDLRYDDGRAETTTVSYVRFPRARTWAEGDRVLAPWDPGWYYPGLIRCVDDETIFIKFDDGDKRLADAAELMPLSVRIGDKVAARRNKGPRVYEPADVIEVRGEELEVRYEDGDTEWTTVSWIRVKYPPETA